MTLSKNKATTSSKAPWLKFSLASAFFNCVKGSRRSCGMLKNLKVSFAESRLDEEMEKA
jgi:hypothetical protein